MRIPKHARKELEAYLDCGLLAAARRALRSPHLCPLSPIRTLHYFLPVIEEVLATPPDPGYLDYLAGKLHPLAQRKAEAVSSQASETFIP